MTKKKPPEPEKPKRKRAPRKAKVIPSTAMVLLPRPEPPGGVAEEVEDPKEGIYQPAHMGIGMLDDEHTEEDAPESLRGRPADVDLAAIDKDWVLRRLVKEANDFGTRTRQTARLKALEMIGNHLGMFERGEDPGGTDSERAAHALTPEERRQKIRELSAELMLTPAFAAKAAT